MQPYWEARVPCKLSYTNDFIRLLRKAHQGYLGISRTRSRTEESICCQGIGSATEKHIHAIQYETRFRYRPVPVGPLILTKSQGCSWQTLGADFMECRGNQHLVVVDYYNKWFEVHVKGLSTGYSQSWGSNEFLWRE